MIRDMIEAPYRDRSGGPEFHPSTESTERIAVTPATVIVARSRLVWPIAVRGDSSILAESDRGP